MIHSGFISGEISEHSESNFHGSVGEQFCLDGFFIFAKSVSRLSKGFVVFISGFPSGSAIFGAFGGFNGCGARFEGSDDVMIAGFEGVGFAP